VGSIVIAIITGSEIYVSSSITAQRWGEYKNIGFTSGATSDFWSRHK
jgi:hypothetical protein